MDIRKDYDTLEWEFLKRLLMEMGFPNKFIDLIMACVTTVSYSLTMNEGLTKLFLGK